MRQHTKQEIIITFLDFKIQGFVHYFSEGKNTQQPENSDN